MWGVGSGKSIGSLAAADALPGTTTYVAPAALRTNLRAEASKAFGIPNLPVTSYQGVAAGKAPPADTVVLDEVQRIGSPTSAQGIAAKQLAMNAKNVIALSATPVRNSPAELAPIMSILTGKNITHEQFRDRYIGTERTRPGGLLGWVRGEPVVERPVLKNTDELRELLRGRIDYYEPETPPVGVTHEDIETEMSRRQADAYEAMFNRLPFLMKWKIRHRYDLTPNELQRFKAFMTGPRQIALSDYPFRTDRDPLKAFEDSGKLREAFRHMQENLTDPRRKGIVYSNFVDAGLRPYAAALSKANIPHAMFHGGLNDVQRKEMVDAFNAGKTRVALVAPAGSEGISLRGAQLTQLLDPAWTEARMRQARARGIRFDSHTDLPEELKQMRVQRFIAKLPLGIKGRLLAALGVDRAAQRATVDDHLIALSERKERLNNQLTTLLKEIAQADQLPQKRAIALDVPNIGGQHLVVQSAGNADLMTALRLAKQHSDNRNFTDKTRILRELITARPQDWYIDSDQGHTKGLTHVSGWRYHLPTAQIADLMPQMTAKVT